eukprot:gene12173-16303_t
MQWAEYDTLATCMISGFDSLNFPFRDYTQHHLLRRLDIFLQITEGIRYAHSKGIAHRDLKPLNILVMNYTKESSFYGFCLDVKICDFNVSSGVQIDDPSSFDNNEGSTRAYSSPEQLNGNTLFDDDHFKTDVWNLGLMLLVILSWGKYQPTNDSAKSAAKDGFKLSNEYGDNEILNWLYEFNYNLAVEIIDGLVLPCYNNMGVEESRWLSFNHQIRKSSSAVAIEINSIMTRYGIPVRPYISDNEIEKDRVELLAKYARNRERSTLLEENIYKEAIEKHSENIYIMNNYSKLLKKQCPERLVEFIQVAENTIQYFYQMDQEAKISHANENKDVIEWRFIYGGGLYDWVLKSLHKNILYMEEIFKLIRVFSCLDTNWNRSYSPKTKPEMRVRIKGPYYHYYCVGVGIEFKTFQEALNCAIDNEISWVLTDDLSLNEIDYIRNDKLLNLLESLRECLNKVKCFNSGKPIEYHFPLGVRCPRYRRLFEKTYYGNNPLHIACENNAPLDIIESLCTIHNTWLSEKNNDGSLPLHSYLAKNHSISISVVQILIESYPSLDNTSFSGVAAKNGSDQLPLHLVTQSNKCKINELKDVIDFLVNKYPASINSEDNIGWLPIHCALRSGSSLEVFKSLLPTDRNLDDICFVNIINKKTMAVEKETTLLHMFFKSNPNIDDLPLFDYLLAECPQLAEVQEVRFDAHHVGKSSHLPLHSATNSLSIPIEFIDRLISIYPDSVKTLSNDEVEYPLQMAIYKLNSIEVIRKLVEMYPEALKNKNGYGLNCIHCCLYDKITNDDIDNRFDTPFDYVEQVLNLCLYHFPSDSPYKGCDMEDHDGDLPLHKAYKRDLPEQIIRKIISCYPEAVTCTNNAKRTPEECKPSQSASNIYIIEN